jgi:hypothetical protein
MGHFEAGALGIGTFCISDIFRLGCFALGHFVGVPGGMRRGAGDRRMREGLVSKS